jgi:H+-translocating NAD(P) transhydrogenase subunit beta
MGSSILSIIYLIASVTFILGLKMLSHPETARKGNLVAAGGMGLAIFGTIFLYTTTEGNHLGNLGWMFAALIVGASLGAVSSRKVKMTAMPEMVSLFNGMGGACAMLISLIEFNRISGSAIELGHFIAIVLGLIIGSISFAGSIIAYLKLSGKQKDISFKGQHIFNGILFVIILVGAVVTYFASPENSAIYFYTTFALAIVYGIFFVLPIGGADMPVVISLLNSLTGVAAACGGFLYDNKAMLTGGILVGAAGTLLTVLMCKAMNRSLLNVIIGNFGGNNAAAASSNESGGVHKEVTMSDAAMVMSYASKVVIVPGYGLAVAQAQHTCHELEKILTDKGVEVTYAIHPVAGRMPGHMNVLLAEADVAYEKLEEMEDANANFKNTDVVLILGANDVVNPAAKNDPASPIYGMPILEVEQAKMVIVNKRSMKAGYAGIENALFYQPKTSMLFGDAKKVLQDLCAEIKAS